jgi:hypothetical protein
VKAGYLFDVEVFSYTGGFAGFSDPVRSKLSEWSDPDDSGTPRLLNP